MRFLPFLLISSVFALNAESMGQTPQTASGTTPRPTPIASTTPVVTVVPAVKERQIVPHGTISFTSKSDGFAVWLPLQPISAHQSQTAPTGETLTTHFFSVHSEPINYVVTSAAIPTSFIKIPNSDPSLVTALLDGTQRGLINSFQAKSLGPHLQKSEALRFDKFAARDLKLSLAKGTVTFLVRLYAAPKTIYSISAIGFKADVLKQAAQIDKVFDSFRILPQ